MKGREKRKKLHLKALQQQMAWAIKTEWAVVYHSGFSACFITSSDSGIFFIALKRGYDHFLPLEMKLILQQLRERERCHVLILYCLHHTSVQHSKARGAACSKLSHLILGEKHCGPGRGVVLWTCKGL